MRSFQQERLIHIVAIALLLMAVQIIAVAEYFGVPARGEKEPPVYACTLEAKICPDGSAVGRAGLNCEFAPCPSGISADMANWQTYRNEEYGFEVTYPEEWDIKSSPVRGEFWIFKKGEEPFVGQSQIFIGVEKKLGNQTIYDVVREKEAILSSYYDIDKNITIDGKQAILSRLVKPDRPPITPWNAGWTGGLHKETKILHQNKIYTLYAVGMEYQEVEKIYDQILSTFKFIE